MARHKKRGRRLPPWLIGLMIAAVIFVLTLLILDYLGYGDDPVIDQRASAEVVLSPVQS